MLEYPFMHIWDIYCVGIIWFGIIVDCIVIFHVCNFWKVPFTTVIMPDFLCALTRIFLLDYYWQILLVSFAESCLQVVHNAEFDRGQREIRQPLELKLWTDQSLLREMLFGLISWWLLWTVSMTLSRPIIGGIYTPVLVLCTPGWSGYSILTLRWLRMMTAG